MSTIYETIGGREAVEAVVTEFYDRVLDDPELEEYFEDADLDELYAHQVQFVSATAGGPVDYEGEDMRTAHEGLGITRADFGRVAQHLEDALLAEGVPEEHVETIISDVASYEEAVVEA